MQIHTKSRRKETKAVTGGQPIATILNPCKTSIYKMPVIAGRQMFYKCLQLTQNYLFSGRRDHSLGPGLHEQIIFNSKMAFGTVVPDPNDLKRMN
jgi:hypothetical protein